VLLGNRRLRDDIQQPADRGLRFAVRIAESLAVGHLCQDGAGQRIDGLDAALVHHRQGGEGGKVELVIRRTRQARLAGQPAGEHQHHGRREDYSPPPGRCARFRFAVALAAVLAAARARRCRRRDGCGDDDVLAAVGEQLYVAPRQEPQEHDRKMGLHPEPHEHAGHVRNHPTRVRHHLQSRHLDSRLRVHLVPALVERLAGVAQGVVHPDPHLPVDVVLRSDQAHVRRVVLGRRRADVVVPAHIDQVHRVRLVCVLEPQRQIVRLAADGNPLRQSQPLGHQIRANRLAVAFAGQRDVGRGHVHLAATVGPTAGPYVLGHRAQPSPRRRGVLFPGLDPPQIRVLQVGGHLDDERQGRILDGLASFQAPQQSQTGNGQHIFFRGRKIRIDDRQLGLANVLSEIHGLAFRDDQSLFDRKEADIDFAEHQQGQADVDQDHAAATLEQQNAARQHHGGGQAALNQLPQDPHPRVAQVGPLARPPKPHGQQGQQNDRHAHQHQLDDPLPRLHEHHGEHDQVHDRQSGQRQLARQPQRRPREDGNRLEAFWIVPAGDHHPRRERTRRDNRQTCQQPPAASLDHEPHYLRCQQIHGQQRPDRGAARKPKTAFDGRQHGLSQRQNRRCPERDPPLPGAASPKRASESRSKPQPRETRRVDRPHQPLRCVREPRWGEEHRHVDPREPAAEVQRDDFPHVHLRLCQRADEDQVDGQDQQHNGQLERCPRPEHQGGQIERVASDRCIRRESLTLIVVREDVGCHAAILLRTREDPRRWRSCRPTRSFPSPCRVPRRRLVATAIADASG